MAKLYFSYAAMNAGKSTILLQASHNYQERGMHTFLLTARLDDRVGAGQIGSRIGLQAPAFAFEPDTNMKTLISAEQDRQFLDCVMVDEAQFLSDAIGFAFGGTVHFDPKVGSRVSKCGGELRVVAVAHCLFDFVH